MSDRPLNDEPCGRCPHPFGEHYESYDGQKNGCAHYDSNRDQRYAGPCDCRGFALVQRWPAAEGE